MIFIFSEDQSETGHILGRADIRGQGHAQERLLSPVHCTCLRLLTHMAMYLGAANGPQVKSFYLDHNHEWENSLSHLKTCKTISQVGKG